MNRNFPPNLNTWYACSKNKQKMILEIRFNSTSGFEASAMLKLYNGKEKLNQRITLGIYFKGSILASKLQPNTMRLNSNRYLWNSKEDFIFFLGGDAQSESNGRSPHHKA
jgi:hypothetical protein